MLLLRKNEESEKHLKRWYWSFDDFYEQGLRDLALVWSWLILYILEFILICVGCGLVLYPVFEYSNILLLMLFFFGFALSLIMLCYLITSFFSRAKTAGLLGVLIIFLTYVPSVLCKYYDSLFHSSGKQCVSRSNDRVKLW